MPFFAPLGAQLQPSKFYAIFDQITTLRTHSRMITFDFCLAAVSQKVRFRVWGREALLVHTKDTTVARVFREMGSRLGGTYKRSYDEMGASFVGVVPLDKPSMTQKSALAQPSASSKATKIEK